jgi:hypothetical protein
LGGDAEFTLRRSACRAALLILVAVAALVAADPAGTAGVDQSYTDPRGDAGPGTDIVGVSVRHDAAGSIAVRVTTSSALPDNHYIAIFVDADNNASTGLALEGRGLDYEMASSRAFGIGFWRWSEGRWVQSSPAGFAVGPTSPNVVEFRTTRAMLGNTNGFAFRVISGAGAIGSGGGLTDTFWDLTQWFQYSLTAKPGLKITRVDRTPKVPYAGESYTLTFSVSRVGRGGRFFGNVGCRARIGSARAQWSGSVDPGSAKCGFRVPANAAGRTISGLMTVTEGATTLRRTFSAKVVRQPLRLIAGKLVETVPPQPRAGALFGYKLPVSIQKGLRDSRPVVPREISRVTCLGRLGGKPIAARESRAVAGAVRCVWDIPAGAAGSTLAATIRAESPQTASATAGTLVHSFDRTVR